MFFSLMLLIAQLSPQTDPVQVEIRGRKFFVEVAETPAEWSQGLMFREKMSENWGMLFRGRRAELRSFWMKNTLIPLDIIFIGPNQKIINIHKMTSPHSEKPLRSNAAALHVLEINGGLSDKWGFKPGDPVKIHHLK